MSMAIPNHNVGRVLLEAEGVEETELKGSVILRFYPLDEFRTPMNHRSDGQ